jgi:26S proteasome regulatory subunit N2
VRHRFGVGVAQDSQARACELVCLLLESFDPHVRYASCVAVGIAMAGSGDTESVALLEPMLTDMTDHVRQGADRARSWERL